MTARQDDHDAAIGHLVAGGVVSEVLVELARAQRRFAPMASPHEGYAVLLEELDELWAEIRDDKRQKHVRRERMRAEATQLAAMALRFLIDCTDEGVGGCSES